jgi:hypothetical protein
MTIKITTAMAMINRRDGNDDHNRNYNRYHN